ncbi:MAG: hypothetical protein KDA78_20165 [Planctomycetaceae bacterium]|nr:hypothetical protein [Planctomycetaceae bacterium]
MFELKTWALALHLILVSLLLHVWNMYATRVGLEVAIQNLKLERLLFYLPVFAPSVITLFALLFKHIQDSITKLASVDTDNKESSSPNTIIPRYLCYSANLIYAINVCGIIIYAAIRFYNFAREHSDLIETANAFVVITSVQLTLIAASNYLFYSAGLIRLSKDGFKDTKQLAISELP